MSVLAVDGSTPIRAKMLPYAHHEIDESDIAAVVAVLRGDWLTTGPLVAEFEQAFAAKMGTKYAVAVNSGTAALHTAMFALEVSPGDEVIVPNLTFIATAYAPMYEGATPVIADVDERGLLDPGSVEQCLSPDTRAVISMDYAGQPCDYDELRQMADRCGHYLVADACHSPGAIYQGKSVAQWIDLACYSLHPVKHITTCEGGMVCTDNPRWAERMRQFRTCGRTTTYESHYLGYNYRLSDVQCALGMSQLIKLDERIAARRRLAARYNEAFRSDSLALPLAHDLDESAWHLYVVRLPCHDRQTVFDAMRARNIGVQWHYLPLHRQPYLTKYARRLPSYSILPDQLMTLPLWPGLTESEQDRVIETLREVDEALAGGRTV